MFICFFYFSGPTKSEVFPNIWNWYLKSSIFFLEDVQMTNSFFKVLKINCKLSTKHSKEIFQAKCRFSIHLSFECKSSSHPLHISDCTFKYPYISNIYTESQEMHMHISMLSIIFLIFLLFFWLVGISLNIKSIGKTFAQIYNLS